MATNPYKNKIVFNGQTLIDLTGDTIEPDKLLEGYTAHDASGAPIVGIAPSGSGSAISIVDTQDAAGGTIRNINAVSLAGDTVSPSVLLSGYTAHNSLGQSIVGTASGGGATIPTNLAENLTISNGFISNTGSISSMTGNNREGYSDEYISVTPGKTYHMLALCSGIVQEWTCVGLYKSDKSWSRRIAVNSAYMSFTPNTNELYCRVSFRRFGDECFVGLYEGADFLSNTIAVNLAMDSYPYS